MYRMADRSCKKKRAIARYGLVEIVEQQAIVTRAKKSIQTRLSMGSFMLPKRRFHRAPFSVGLIWAPFGKVGPRAPHTFRVMRAFSAIGGHWGHWGHWGLKNLRLGEHTFRGRQTERAHETRIIMVRYEDRLIGRFGPRSREP